MEHVVDGVTRKIYTSIDERGKGGVAWGGVGEEAEFGHECGWVGCWLWRWMVGWECSGGLDI